MICSEVYLYLIQLTWPAPVDLHVPENWRCCHSRPEWWLEYAKNKIKLRVDKKVKDVILPPLVLSTPVGLLSVDTYLIYKQAPLCWFGVQWEDVQVSSGGETWFQHSNQRILRYTCNLGHVFKMLATSLLTNNCRVSNVKVGCSIYNARRINILQWNFPGLQSRSASFALILFHWPWLQIRASCTSLNSSEKVGYIGEFNG